MGYTSRALLVARYGEDEIRQLTDRDHQGEIDDETLGIAMARADAEIDAALGVRYALPLTAVPPLIEGVAGVLVRYQLYDREMPDPVRNQYLDARRLLDDVAAGRRALGLPDASRPGPRSEASMTLAPGRAKIFHGGFR